MFCLTKIVTYITLCEPQSQVNNPHQQTHPGRFKVCKSLKPGSFLLVYVTNIPALRCDFIWKFIVHERLWMIEYISILSTVCAQYIPNMYNKIHKCLLKPFFI